MIKYYLIGVLILTSIYSCSPDNSEVSEDQNITLEIKVLEDGGVLLRSQSSIVATDAIGFDISRNETFTNSIKLVGVGTSKSFEVAKENDLIYNEEYFVRSYIGSGDDIVYSEIKSFVSLGSKAPNIESIHKSHIGDTTSIVGKNFGNTIASGDIRIWFKDESARVLQHNDSLIKCIVPTGFVEDNPVVTLQILEKKVKFYDFELFAPIITSLSSSNLKLGDTLSLYGDHFDNVLSRNKVLVNDNEVKILDANRKELMVVLPSDQKTSSIKFSLFSQNQSTIYESGINFPKPIFDKIEGNYNTLDTLAITGSNFSPLIEANEVFFNDIKAKVFSSTSTELKVQLPIGPFTDKSPDISIKLMDYDVKQSDAINIEDIWLFKAQTQNAFYLSGDSNFEYDGKLYMVKQADGTSNIAFLVFDPSTMTFDKFEVGIPESNLYYAPFQVVKNPKTDKIYFFFNKSGKNFYEFDLSSKKFNQLPDFTAYSSAGPEVFIINSKLYVIGGRITESYPGQELYESISTIYYFDLESLKWEIAVKTETGFGISERLAFIQDDSAYIVYGAGSTSKKLFEFNSSNNSFTEIEGPYNAKYGNASFTYNNKGYAYFSDPIEGTPENRAHKFNFSTKSWERIEALNARYYTYFNFPDGYSAYKVNGRIFIAIYHYPYYRFYEADLDKL